MTQSRAKESVDARISFVGFAASLGGLAYVAMRTHGDLALLAVTTVYGLSLGVLFGASTLYHGVPMSGRATAILRKLDHASIYLLIAGTYTPVLFMGLDGAWRIATTAAIWGVAAAGIALTFWFVNAPRWVSAAVYIAMGWFAVVPAFKLVHTLPLSVSLLLAGGGLLYTTGALIYATKSMNFSPGRFGFHEIFHLFVLAGAALQFAAIAQLIVPR